MVSVDDPRGGNGSLYLPAQAVLIDITHLVCLGTTTNQAFTRGTGSGIVDLPRRMIGLMP